jgi:hypothetical protein
MSRNCFLGLDDGYFDIQIKRLGKQSETYLVGVVTCPHTVANILLKYITIDGLDGTIKALEVIDEASSLHTIKTVFLDGVTYAGFNLVNPYRIYEISSIPVVVIFRYDLELDKILLALKKHFKDYYFRYSVIEQIYKASHILYLNKNTKLRYTAIGISVSETENILYNLCKPFLYPYPLYIADRIASALGRIKFGLFHK